MYTVGGVWRPEEWSSNIAKLLYNVFTFIILALLYFLMITQFMDIILVVDNIDDFATNVLMFLTIVAVTCKATIVVLRRDAIINLVQVLLTAPCKPRDEDEMAIQKKFDKFIRWVFIAIPLHRKALVVCYFKRLTNLRINLNFVSKIHQFSTFRVKLTRIL